MDATVQLQSSKHKKISEEQNGGEAKDEISKLPDPVLHYILSFLPTKETIRTSILSTRWQLLWTSISNIDLNDLSSRPSQKKEADYPMCRTFFLDFVERVLLLHDTSDIKRFCLRFKVPVSASRVHSWVTAAVKHKLQELDLSLPLRGSFVLPCCLFTCESLTVLKLKMKCVLRVPTSICFPRLKNLALLRVTFLDDNSTEQLFSGCPVLEELALVNCGWETIKRITILLPTLKSLTFRHPPSNEGPLLDCNIKIHCAKLVSLHCQSDFTVDCLLYDRLSPINACIDLVLNHREGAGGGEVVNRAIKLLQCIPGVESLTITGDFFMSLSHAEDLLACLPTYGSLTNLQVITEFLHPALLYFFQKSPKLESLHMPEGLMGAYDFDEEEWTLELVPSCLSCLKTISISKFNVEENEIDFLEFFLKNAAVLERVMLYGSKRVSANTKVLEEIGNELQMLPRGSGSCVIELLGNC